MLYSFQLLADDCRWKNRCLQADFNKPSRSLIKKKKNEHTHRNDSLHLKVCAPQPRSTGTERSTEVTRQRLQRPPEKGGVRRFLDLFPPHQVVAPSQFSRDSSFCALQVTGSQGAKGGGGEEGGRCKRRGRHLVCTPASRALRSP